MTVAETARLVPLLADDADRRVLAGGVERVVFRRVGHDDATLAGLAPLISRLGAIERHDTLTLR